MEIGTRIRRLRKQNKLTQKKFAEMVGITSRTLCQYEKGGRTPKIDKIKKIAEIFSVSVDYLVGESDEETDTHVTRECHEERVNILLRQRDNLADYVKHLKKEIKEREAELETLKFKTDCRNSWKNKFFKAQEEVEAWKAKSREIEQAWEISSSNEEKLQKEIERRRSESAARESDLKIAWADMEESRQKYRKCYYEKEELQKQVDELKERLRKNLEHLQQGEELFEQTKSMMEQAVKDTAKEILSMFDDRNYISEKELKKAIAEHYGVEME